MPKGDKKILKYNHEEKSLKVLFIIYIDTECLLKKQHSYPNNLQKSYTERKAKHDYYRERDCIKKLCEN